MPTTGTQGGILLSQTNTMTMGGAQITQNVVSTNAPPQTLTSTSVPQAQMNMQVTYTRVRAYTYDFLKNEMMQLESIKWMFIIYVYRIVVLLGLKQMLALEV